MNPKSDIYDRQKGKPCETCGGEWYPHSHSKSECCDLCFKSSDFTKMELCADENCNCHLPKPMEWEEEFDLAFLTDNNGRVLGAYTPEMFKSFISSQISQAKAEGFKEGVERCLEEIQRWDNKYYSDDLACTNAYHYGLGMVKQQLRDKLKKLV